MTSEIEAGQTPFEAIKQVDEEGIEYWWARDLMVLMGYVQWRHFNLAIGRARATMANGGTYDPKDHFWSLRRPAGDYGRTPDNNPSDQGGRPSLDFRLTRDACYHIALDGDPNKDEIKAAKQYFVSQTIKMERIEQQPMAAMPTHVDALRGWADALEAKQKAELIALEARAEADMLRPPAEAWNTLVDTGQDYDMATAASILNRDPVIETGRDRLRNWMMSNGMLYRRAGGQLVPYSAHLDHIQLKPQSRPDYDADDSRSRKEANAQVRITVRGLEWIQQRMREQARPDIMQRPRPVRLASGTLIDLDQVRKASTRR